MSIRIGLIGGTGLASALSSELEGQVHEVETPFGHPSAPLIMGTWQGIDIAFLPRHGLAHTYPPTAVPYRANIYALKSVGVTHIIASGATGSLREEFAPRDLVIVDQVLDRTTRRVNTFFDQPGIAAHIDFAEPFCPHLRGALLAAAKKIDVTVHEAGTYVCMEGPAFSTCAESRLHRSWGGDLIGMTAMPEAKLAREAEICYSMIAMPTDYDSWRPHQAGVSRKALLEEIISNVEHATKHSVQLIKACLQSAAESDWPPCGCQNALDLAVWTKKESISPQTAAHFGILLSRYFKL